MLENSEDVASSLLEMSGITVTDDPVEGMLLVESLRKKIDEGGEDGEKALWGLIYLQTFHPSELVNHEAVFNIGESGRFCTFLDIPALWGRHPVVRHEACLAMGASGSTRVGKYKRTLKRIALNDKDQMVRDSALFALKKLEMSD